MKTETTLIEEKFIEAYLKKIAFTLLQTVYCIELKALNHKQKKFIQHELYKCILPGLEDIDDAVSFFKNIKTNLGGCSLEPTRTYDLEDFSDSYLSLYENIPTTLEELIDEGAIEHIPTKIASKIKSLVRAIYHLGNKLLHEYNAKVIIPTKKEIKFPNQNRNVQFVLQTQPASELDHKLFIKDFISEQKAKLFEAERLIKEISEGNDTQLKKVDIRLAKLLDGYRVVSKKAKSATEKSTNRKKNINLKRLIQYLKKDGDYSKGEDFSENLTRQQVQKYLKEVATDESILDTTRALAYRLLGDKTSEWIESYIANLNSANKRHEHLAEIIISKCKN